MSGLARGTLGQQYFDNDPTANAEWKTALAEQTPPPVTTVPVMVAQGTADPVVVPNTTALLNDVWCKAGANLSTVWVGGEGHSNLGQRAGTMVGEWFYRILAGQNVTSTCDVPDTVAPYPTPVDPGFGTSVT